jgi:hypothetical protein
MALYILNDWAHASLPPLQYYCTVGLVQCCTCQSCMYHTLWGADTIPRLHSCKRQSDFTKSANRWCHYCTKGSSSVVNTSNNASPSKELRKIVRVVLLLVHGPPWWWVWCRLRSRETPWDDEPCHATSPCRGGWWQGFAQGFCSASCDVGRRVLERSLWVGLTTEWLGSDSLG